MALFVPNSNPWGGGLQALADAVTQAPMNRAKIRQMELDAANAAADAERAEQRFRLDQQRFELDRQRLEIDAANKAAAEARAAETHPLTLKDTQLGIDQKSIANEFAAQNNPLLIGKSQADLHKIQTENMLEDTRIGGLPGLADSLADSVYGGVEAGLPEWNLLNSLSEPALPPKITLPGMEDTGMDYPGMGGTTSAMDEMSRRMGLRDQIGTMADAAVLSDPQLDTAKWIKDTTEAMLAGDPTATAVVAEGGFGDTDFGRAATIVAQLREKQRQGIPLSPFEQDQLSLAMSKIAPVTTSTVVTPDGPVTNISKIDPFAAYGDGSVSPPAGSPPIVQQPTMSPETAAATPPVSGVSGAGAGRGVGPGGIPITKRNIDGVELTTIGQRNGKPLTEYEGKARLYSSRIGTAFSQFAPIIGIDLQTGVYDPSKATVGGVGDSVQMWADRMLTDYVGPEFSGLAASGEQERFRGAATAILNPAVRFDSGAATPPLEYARAMEEFIPSPNGDPQANLEKVIRLQALVGAMEDIYRRTGIDPTTASDEQLRYWKQSGMTDEAVNRQLQQLTPAGGVSPVSPASPQTVQPPPQGQTVDPVQEEEWTIDANGNVVRVK